MNACIDHDQWSRSNLACPSDDRGYRHRIVWCMKPRPCLWVVIFEEQIYASSRNNCIDRSIDLIDLINLNRTSQKLTVNLGPALRYIGYTWLPSSGIDVSRKIRRFWHLVGHINSKDRAYGALQICETAQCFLKAARAHAKILTSSTELSFIASITSLKRTQSANLLKCPLSLVTSICKLEIECGIKHVQLNFHLPQSMEVWNSSSKLLPQVLYTTYRSCEKFEWYSCVHPRRQSVVNPASALSTRKTTTWIT